MAPLSVVNTTPLTLFHDPSSPASEFALEALHLGCRQADVRRVDLPSSRPSTAELRDLATRLVGDDVDALVSRGARYDRLGLDLDGADLETVLATLSDHPELLATPLLDDGSHTMLGTDLPRAEVWAITGRVIDAVDCGVSVLRAA